MTTTVRQYLKAGVAEREILNLAPALKPAPVSEKTGYQNLLQTSENTNVQFFLENQRITKYLNTFNFVKALVPV